jgi:hypothetical protein
MSKCYQYTADGYFAGEAEDYGFLPHNATHVAPTPQDGHIPHWTGSAWEQVKDHKGKEGWLDGKPHTIKEYGPLPDGWSDTPPPPTPEELAERRRAEILARLAEIDAASVRPLRAIAQGEGTDFDRDKLAALDAEAVELRAEFAGLQSS